MAQQKGLGKGLGALLGDAVNNGGEGGVTLHVREIEPNTTQPRTEFDQGALEDLADSIRENGIIQPLIVRKLSSGFYQIIAGERRWRAAQIAGLDKVPAIVYEANDRRAMEIALIENLQREDLNPIEEGRGFKTLIEEYGMTQEEVAARIGRSRPAVANALRLLTLPKNAQEYLAFGNITSGHARAILQLEGQKARAAAADKIIKDGLNVRQTEQLVHKFGEQEQKKPKTHRYGYPIAMLEHLEATLEEALSRKVRITSGRDKGKITIEFYGDDDLTMLVEALKGRF